MLRKYLYATTTFCENFRRIRNLLHEDFIFLVPWSSQVFWTPVSRISVSIIISNIFFDSIVIMNVIIYQLLTILLFLLLHTYFFGPLSLVRGSLLRLALNCWKMQLSFIINNYVFIFITISYLLFITFSYLLFITNSYLLCDWILHSKIVLNVLTW